MRHPRHPESRLLIFGGGGLGLGLTLLGYGLNAIGAPPAVFGLGFIGLGGVLLIGVGLDAVFQIIRRAFAASADATFAAEDQIAAVSRALPEVAVDQVSNVVRILVSHPDKALAPGDYEAEVVDLSGVESLMPLPIPWHVRWRDSSQHRLQILPGQEGVLELVTLRHDAAQQMLWGHRREPAYLFHSPNTDHGVDAPLTARDWKDIGTPIVATRISRVAPPYHGHFAVRLGFQVTPTMQAISETELVGGLRAHMRHDQERDRQAEESKVRLYELVQERFAGLVHDATELEVLARGAFWAIDAPRVYGVFTYPIIEEGGHLVLRFGDQLKGVGVRADGDMSTLGRIAQVHRSLIEEAKEWDWGRDGHRTEQRALTREIQRRLAGQREV